jgi:hypothetical protein
MPDKLQKVDESMALEFRDFVDYQSTQSQAFAMGWLSLDEAQTIYTALGEAMSESNGGWQLALPSNLIWAPPSVA